MSPEAVFSPFFLLVYIIWILSLSVKPMTQLSSNDQLVLMEFIGEGVLFIYLLFEVMLTYYVSGSHCNYIVEIFMKHNGFFL